MKRILVALALLALPAAASAQGQCFFMSQIHGAKAPDDNRLFLLVRTNVYRFDMTPACKGLSAGPNAYSVGLANSDSVCGPAQIKIALTNGQRCSVSAMTVLTPAQAKALPPNALPVEAHQPR